VSDDLAGTPAGALDADMDRRGFLSRATGFLSGIAAIVLGWPLVSFLLGPRVRETAGQYVEVPGLDRVSAGQPVQLEFPFIETDAYLSQNVTHQVWAVRGASGELTVYSPVCPHLGCSVSWDPGSHNFVCPCHGSVFSIDGRVVAGPSPRPLDTLPYRVRDGRLEVRWEAFKVGVAGKVRV
jgi:menaquinol-cytochrome c reductase iron-sulfur subunit